MIKINVKKDNITIKGHAGYSEQGFDIVCASVSTLAISTINAIIRFDENAIKYEEKDGYLKIDILKHTKETAVLLENMVDLLKELEKQYNKNIKINEEV
ncbi:MAG TPA: ribosomal-processing cysteine protease Prp [Tenericutes bacterium]|nr:ribosomal-processing cysteine protease Prp [Mycoplasmatota bacterium]